MTKTGLEFPILHYSSEMNICGSGFPAAIDAWTSPTIFVIPESAASGYLDPRLRGDSV
jgi:hypothetical protein